MQIEVKKSWPTSDEKEVEDHDSENDELIDTAQRRPRARPSQHSFGFLTTATNVLLISIIILQAFVIIQWRTELSERPPKYSALDSSIRIRPHLLLTSGVLNRFWRGDELEETNKSWNRINSGHGIIKMDADFASKQGFPDTMRHPYDESQSVYALEAYHMIHCIQILRKDFLLIREGKEPTKPLEHAMHCFDALRQSVMCQANDELLIITGHGHENGANQTRQCRSWDALRDYATANTACYWDDELPEGQESRWKMCDDGTDGLPVGNLLD